MTIEQIKSMLSGDEYSFLKTNPHLHGRIMFLTLGGSYAYGTNVETSDVDIRGCAMNSKSDLLGLTNFQQVVNTQTDTIIYGFKRMIGLLICCNTNAIEMLGCNPQHYLYVSEAGKILLDNHKLFLDQRAASSFSGYATEQLRMLKKALAMDNMLRAKEAEHIREAMESSIKDFESKYSCFDKGSISIYTGDSERDDFEKELFCNIHLEKYPATDFRFMLEKLNRLLYDYVKLDRQNYKKDDDHINKYAMHTIRLYLMCLDILEKGEVNTYRYEDRELLLSIRNGRFQREDGSYMPEFFELVGAFEKRLQYAKENTSLPEHPDMRKVEELVMEINRRSILNEDKEVFICEPLC